MQRPGMSKQETKEYEDARAERLNYAQRTGVYVDEFTTPLNFLTKEERVAFALATLRQLPKCVTDKKNKGNKQ